MFLFIWILPLSLFRQISKNYSFWCAAEFCFHKLLYCCSITVVCILSQPFPLPTPAKPTSLPCFHPPLWFCLCVLIVVPENPSTHCPFPRPLWLLLDCSYFQCLWLYFVCFSLLLIMFQLEGEIIWYLSLTTRLISLSIMLFSSIHAVAKGISSFFLSAA